MSSKVSLSREKQEERIKRKLKKQLLRGLRNMAYFGLGVIGGWALSIAMELNK